jgi:thiamine transport system ATP-binding protein
VTIPRLSTTGLAIGYRGAPLVTGIDLAILPGEIVAVLGASGSGKSTLLSTLAGVTPALDGRILVDGVDVTAAPIHRRGIGIIFQEPLLFTHLNVADNVAYGLRRHGVDRATARARAADLLDWLGLAGYGSRPVDELSGGQAQRVALARALAPRPSVLLLDEPFSALDQDLRQRLAADVATMLRREEVAALHVTHDADEAAGIADRVCRMSELGSVSSPD